MAVVVLGKCTGCCVVRKPRWVLESIPPTWLPLMVHIFLARSRLAAPNLSSQPANCHLNTSTAFPVVGHLRSFWLHFGTDTSWWRQAPKGWELSAAHRWSLPSTVVFLCDPDVVCLTLKPRIIHSPFHSECCLSSSVWEACLRVSLLSVTTVVQFPVALNPQAPPRSDDFSFLPQDSAASHSATCKAVWPLPTLLRLLGCPRMSSPCWRPVCGEGLVSLHAPTRLTVLAAGGQRLRSGILVKLC